MNPLSTHEVTDLLLDWSGGNEAGLNNLAPLVEKELHRLARRYMQREGPGQTLQTTALVNEAYLRLIDQKRVHWQNRAHFFALAAQFMRRILVDHARSRRYAKRGGGAWKVSLDEAMAITRPPGTDVLAVDEALEKLAAEDERKSKVVELRFFGDLSVEETAEALQISPATVKREWQLARAWLYNLLSNES